MHVRKGCSTVQYQTALLQAMDDLFIETASTSDKPFQQSWSRPVVLLADKSSREAGRTQCTAKIWKRNTRWV